MSPRASLVLAVCFASSMGCASSTGSVAITVVTDLTPVREFVAVRSRLYPGPGAERSRVRDAAFGEVFSSSPFGGEGVPVAFFDDVELGTWYVDVSLVDADGLVVLERTAILDVAGDRSFRVVLTRSCRDVSCPGAGDAPEATECLHGACVPPECNGDDDEGCPMVECVEDADCASDVACVVTRCEAGACLASPEDARCDGDLVCDAQAGCVCDGCDCEAGSTREVPCGSCGTVEQVCGADGRWTDAGACSGEGECAPGTRELGEACGTCGVQVRECGAACSFGGWSCEEDASRCNYWVLDGTMAAWQGHQVGGPHAPTEPVRAAFDVDARDHGYVLAGSSVHVFRISTHSFTETRSVAELFPEAAADPALRSGYSVPAAHGARFGGDPDIEGVTLSSPTHAYLYDYSMAAGTFTHDRAVECCGSAWDGELAPDPTQVTASWLDVLNEQGYVSGNPMAICGSSETRVGPYAGVLTSAAQVHINEAGSCFQFITQTPYASFGPFARPGAPDPARIRAAFWHDGLHLFVE